MNVNLSPPPTLAGNPREQINQMQRYLFQLQRELNIALDASGLEEVAKALEQRMTSGTGPLAEYAGEAQSLKDLIVKNAHRVEREMDELERRLEGRYVAVSDFGTFTENFENAVQETALGLINNFKYNATTTQTLPEMLEGLSEYIVQSEAYTKQGLLYFEPDGTPVYGFAVGDLSTRVTVNGEETLVKEELMATFSSGRINFWQNGQIVAYYANRMMYVTEGMFLQSIQLGDWIITGEGRLDIDWAGDD